MKRLIPIILFLILFSGCKIKEYTPVIPTSFDCEAVVSTGDFLFNCEICCNMDKNVTSVKILDTSAKGLSFFFDGDKLNFNYDNFDYAINGKAFTNNNTAIIIYQIFNYLNSGEELNVKRIESGYKYEGKIPFGDFILIQNEDMTLKSISFRHSEYRIDFKQKDGSTEPSN